MPKQYVQFIGGAYQGREAGIDAQALINYYVEGDNATPEGSSPRSKRYAVPTPGLTSYYSFTGTSGVPRGLYHYNGAWLAVIGNKLYSYDGNTQTTLGQLLTSTGRCQFVDNGAANGRQVLIIDSAGNGYVLMTGIAVTGASWASSTVTYTFGAGNNSWGATPSYLTVTGVSPSGYNVAAVSTSSLSAGTVSASVVSNPGTYVSGGVITLFMTLTNAGNGWPANGGGALTWQDGYGLFNQLNTPVLWWTNAYDCTTINGLNFATKEGHLDKLVSVMSDGVRVYLLGQQTTEIWYDQGVVNEAFARLPGALYYRGCLSQYAISIIDNSVVWLGCDINGYPQVYQARGSAAPVAISTPQIEYQLSKSTLTDAFAFSYMQEGHIFWVLTLPTTGITWVWDATTELWHQRSSSASAKGEWLIYYTAVNPSTSNALYGMDASTPTLYYIDPTNNTDNGTAITRTIVGPTVDISHTRQLVTYIEIVCNAGTSTGPSSGTISLSWSKDSAQTWNTPISWTLTNSPTQRLYWNNLGDARQWTFKLTSQTKAIIYGMVVDVMTTERLPAFPSITG